MFDWMGRRYRGDAAARGHGANAARPRLVRGRSERGHVRSGSRTEQDWRGRMPPMRARRHYTGGVQNLLHSVHAAQTAQAQAQANAPARPTALIHGACGATGEALLNQLLGGEHYALVTAVTRLPLPSTTRKLRAHYQAQPEGAGLTLPHADEAYLVIGEHNSFYRRDEAFRALRFDDLPAAARAARAAGIARLAVVAPVAIYSHSSAFRHSLMNLAEYDLHALGFETLVLVRPAAPEKFARHTHWGRRIGAFMLRQLHGLMPEAYHPPTSKSIAAAAVAAMRASRPGLSIIDADAVRAPLA